MSTSRSSSQPRPERYGRQPFLFGPKKPTESTKFYQMPGGYAVCLIGEMMQMVGARILSQLAPPRCLFQSPFVFVGSIYAMADIVSLIFVLSPQIIVVDSPRVLVAPATMPRAPFCLHRVLPSGSNDFPVVGLFVFGFARSCTLQPSVERRSMPPSFSVVDVKRYVRIRAQVQKPTGSCLLCIAHCTSFCFPLSPSMERWRERERL